MPVLTMPSVGGGAKGHTGMGIWIIPENFGAILEFLKKIFKNHVYQPEVWDCEDMVCYGVAQARCQFPGCTVGIALKGEKRGEQGHAQIILWDIDPAGHVVKYMYFDPSFGNKTGGPESFTPDVIIPFPTERASGMITPHPSPLDKLPLLNGLGLSLDGDYDFDQVGLIKSLVENGRKNGFGECKPPDDPIRKKRSEDLRFFTMRDRTFDIYTKLKKDLAEKKTIKKAIPLGIAFGALKVGNRFEDTARLVLWKDRANFTYWHPTKGEPKKDPQFTPRIVLV